MSWLNRLLTTGVDTSLVGGAGDDTYNGTDTTLTAGDILSGGAGNDVLSIVSAASTLGVGVTSTGIETVRVTATGATTVNLQNFDGVTTVGNNASSNTVTYSNSKSIPTIEQTNSSTNTTVTFLNANVTAGTADTAAIVLNGAATSASPTIQMDGVETLNISTTGSASGSTIGGADWRVNITDNALKTANVSGSVGARLGVTTSGATGLTDVGVVNASTATGAMDISVTAGSSGLLSVTGGSGDDRITVGTAITAGALTKDMTVAGGTGTDTLIVSSASKAGTGVTQPGANVSGFEVLEIAAGGSASIAAFPTNTFTSVTAKGTATLSDVGTSALTVNVTPATATGTVTITRATNGSGDTATVNLSPTTSGTFAGLSVANEDTLTINSGGDGANTITTLTNTDLKTLTVTGNRGLTITNAMAGTALATVNASANTGTVFSFIASASTANMTVTGSGGVPATAAGTLNTITTGSGNDSVTGSAYFDNITTNAGNDTISAGAGNDTISAGIGSDVVDAGEGDNDITTDLGNDSITAGAGNDLINAGGGLDTVIAGGGDDIIAVTTLTDSHSIDGGTGTDRLSTTTAATITSSTLADATFVNTTESVAPRMSSINTAYIKVTEAGSGSTTPQTLDLTNSTGMGTLYLAIDDAGPSNGYVKVNNFDGTAITLYGALSGGNLAEARGVTIDGTSQAALTVTLEDYDTALTSDTFTLTGVQAATIAARSTSQFTGSADTQSSLGVVTANSVDSLTITTSGAAAAGNAALTLETVSASLATSVRLTAGANDVLKITGATGLATSTGLVTSFTVGPASGSGSAGGSYDIDKINLGTSSLTSARIVVGEGGALSSDGNTTVATSQSTDLDASKIASLTLEVGAAGVAQLDLSGIEVTSTGSGGVSIGSGATLVLKNSLGLASTASSYVFTGRGDLDFDDSGVAVGNTVSLVGSTMTFNTSGLTVDADSLVVNSSTTGASTITTGIGTDSITGGAGNDVINPGAAADTVVGGAGNDSITITEGLSVQATDVVRIGAVAGTTAGSTDSARVQNTGANGDDTGGDTITGFELANDIIEVSATNVAAFVHGTHTAIGSAGTGTVSATGVQGEFTKSTLLIQLDSAAAADTIAIGAGTTGDIAVTFSSMTNSGAAVTDISAIETTVEGRIRYNLTGTTGADTLTGGALADTLAGGNGADSITGGAGADSITGGAGADTIVLGGDTSSDTVVMANNDSVATIGGAGNAGTISGFDVVTGFVTGTTAANKDLLDFAGTAAVGAIARFALNGTDSTLTIGGAAVGSHAIANGVITFHTGDLAGAAITVDSDAKLAAVVQYLTVNDIGNAGDTLAFVYGADTYVYSQTATTAGSVGGYNLVKITGVAVNALETTASTTDLNILIG